MQITRKELKEYNEKGKATGIGMAKWIMNQRNNTISADSDIKTEREEIMEALDAEGIEYKKNASTKALKELLGDK